MSRARLAVEVEAAALIRRVAAAGGAGVLERRGADGAGALALKLVDTSLGFGAPAACCLTRTLQADGARAWAWLVGPEPAFEGEVDAALARQAGYDPDLWIVSLEDREPSRHIDDPVIG